MWHNVSDFDASFDLEEATVAQIAAARHNTRIASTVEALFKFAASLFILLLSAVILILVIARPATWPNNANIYLFLIGSVLLVPAWRQMNALAPWAQHVLDALHI
jgi:hypothetical protein